MKLLPFPSKFQSYEIYQSTILFAIYLFRDSIYFRPSVALFHYRNFVL